MTDALNHIVLIEDNETTSFLNNRLLSRLGVAKQVSSFSKAEEALKFLWSGEPATSAEAAPTPDLIFVDLKMPGMSGFDFLERYSQLPTDAQERTVVAVLTTSMHGADTARVAQYPNVEYLTKPLTEEKMQRLLAKRFAVSK
ncbi:response regulator [Hymenobacter sp. H14-R3]|uniref:response regulator n=1 Tax=Hymenobacter sp. H14-R3 TaxID=3046308 RepID=UPI0024B8F691|nr:response regulator [Hymenobacter sp. H14-R3]MDJ0366876.1 response regulator [Hymenobacter sp. H14-R3]